MQSGGVGGKQDKGVDLNKSSNGGEDATNVPHTANLSRPLYGFGLDYPSMALSPTSYGYGYGYGYGAWTFTPPLMPLPPLLPSTAPGRGLFSHPLPSLGVQGGSIRKKHPTSAFAHGRGPTRGRATGYGGKILTKEALDADLDEFLELGIFQTIIGLEVILSEKVGTKWRLKDKRLAGQSLDAELDNHQSKKDDLHSDAI